MVLFQILKFELYGIQKVNKSSVEFDIAMLNILSNEVFVRKNSVGNKMYSNSLKQFRFFLREYVEDDVEEQKIEGIILGMDNNSQKHRQKIKAYKYRRCYRFHNRNKSCFKGGSKRVFNN